MNRELNIFITSNGSLQLDWTDTEEFISKSAKLFLKEIYNHYLFNKESWLLFIAFCDKSIPLSPSLEFWRNFTGEFAVKLSRTPDLEVHRDKVRITFEEREFYLYLDCAPLMTGLEYLNIDLLKSVLHSLNHEFTFAIKTFDGTVEKFIQSYGSDIHLVGRIFFHLVENKSGEQPFAFLATYSTRLDEHGKSKHLPLKYALQEYKDDNQKLLDLLTTVHVASGQSAFIAELEKTGELFYPLAWSAIDAFTFLKEIPIYEKAGILCRIPNWWKGNTSSLSLNISVGDKQPSFVGMDAILSFNPRLFLGDDEISEEDVRQLLQQSEGLAFIKNKWVAVDPEKLKMTIEAYELSKKMINNENLSFRDAIRLQLNPENTLSIKTNETNLTVSHGQWLESVIQKLLNPDKISSITPGKGFKANLRAYQEKGLNWLYFLHTLQFGACLADDMGLGKTIQLLGFLNALKSNNTSTNYTSLLIIPASLISNWVNEIKRFSPSLIYFVAHPDIQFSMDVEKIDDKFLNKNDLIITTYSMVQKYEWIQSHTWSYVILDEAQAIKNPGTKQTLAVKKLSAENRIVMTGTPVENRLSDLWSLFDFLNPGLLGSLEEFGKFSKNIKNDTTGYSRLRKLISPYILRRLKTDKTVISDLPDKIEMKTYSLLSKKQIVLYEELLDKLKITIEETDGIQRKGIILASLIKFKQICNHPDQYLGTGGYDEEHSGKFSRIKEICETIYDKREKVLIFTQFKEITVPLSEYLGKIFERKGLVLHGSIPVGKRKDIIEQFQSNSYVPFMVLSLKAGGVGLNLTEANHVIHFDRWWNPAVENQATDRAFRIGQKKNVIVHKFITKGTVEENIDLMIESKLKLSNEVVESTGENWITEMNNKELINLFKLSL